MKLKEDGPVTLEKIVQFLFVHKGILILLVATQQMEMDATDATMGVCVLVLMNANVAKDGLDTTARLQFVGSTPQLKLESS